ncbi:hypothetical protein INN71_10025 [Nocardioides sp. ChNu-153]|uniref:hypothetical protein n=1 Tax=unclassified Nocardioides TaxID=2615069 RepID=UPI002406996A|nr:MULTISPECIES: hypothetical protein [unclassified Nocardioides]MDF9715321.1 hypothetical protein [Nocardioides sp. ChNu-99]MDN7121728.1 hypothetical protein [Nocardioides sp. ChNu-153]
MSERAAPYHCPYCAEEDLRPHETTDPTTGEVTSPAGAWECRSCLRAFSLRMIGRLPRPAGITKGAPA